MADDKKAVYQNVEKAKISPEESTSAEHFLEQSPEAEPVSEKSYSKIEKGGERNSEVRPEVDENLFPGDDIVSQSAYHQQQDARVKEIEQVLEKDLSDIYVKLAPDKQKQFKILGEQTAGQINDLINKGKVTIKKIVELIRRWLMIIPGVNRYFLEQEAKIKADEIMKIKNNL